MPGWASRALAGKSLSLSQLWNDVSDDKHSIPLPSARHSMWGPVVPLRPISDVDFNSPVPTESGGRVSGVVADRPGVREFPRVIVDSKSHSSMSRPKPSSELVEKCTSLPESDDKPLLSEDDGVVDLVDIVLEDVPSSSESGRASPPSQMAYHTEESALSGEVRHVRFVDNQHVSAETVSDDERHPIKMVPGQFVGSETEQVEDRIHLRMSSLAGATAETRELPERSSVQLVDGHRVSDETIGETVVKPCIHIHADRHATDETVPSSQVCFQTF